MSVSLKGISGVDSVRVSLEKGLAAVRMKPGNTATLKQLNDAITRNGFAMKDSTATVAGTVVGANGRTTLHVSGSNEVLQLEPQSGVPSALALAGKSVVVDGVIPEAAKGKAPDSIRYLSIVEERPK